MNYIENNVSKKEIRETTLNIFKKILSVCDKLDIQCWVMYGTLIGAVRHKGFIPWDDDFVKECVKNRKLLFPYYIDHFLGNSNYPFYLARICDSNHLLKFNNFDYTSGIFIDLYPFDGMGDNVNYWKSKSSNRYKFKIRLLQAIVWERNLKNPFVGKNGFTKLARGTLSLYAKSRSNKYWMTKLDKEATKFSWNSSEYVGLIGWGTNRVYKIKREWFNETKWLQFEDIKVPVPGEYRKVLNAIYGDYMKLPPKEKRVPTHWYKAYKLNTSTK